MKALTQKGLVKLIQLIKSSFIAKTDVIETSSVDIDGTPTTGSSHLITSGGVYSSLGGKVDKVSGKGLSSEDYTSNEKSKLAGIAAGAEVNVQSDWNQTNTASDDYIKNKPTIPTALSQLSGDGTHRTVTDSEKTTWGGKQEALVSGTNIKTVNNQSLLGSGNIEIQGGGGVTNHDFTFPSTPIADNTTSFTFPANQRCYQSVNLAAGATLTFAVNNKADNYLRIHNTGSSEATIEIGTVTYNSTSQTVIKPAEIKVAAGKYIELSVVADGTTATFTASGDLQ